VIVETQGPLLCVTLNRPEKRNAVNCEVMCRLYDAWVELDRDDALRVAILTGRGNTFCAGMDLGENGKLRGGVADNEWMERVRREPQLIYGAWLKTYRPTKPVILAAEGFARAGGTEILQGTDIRVAGESARFGVEARFLMAAPLWLAARSPTRSRPRCCWPARISPRGAPSSSAW
jgi:enoyl-CoA hydratase